MLEPSVPGLASADRPEVWSYRQAIVAFEDRADTALLRLLAPGFRHCFCLLGDGTRWTLLDPLEARIQLLSFTGCGSADLLHHLADDGRRILVGRPIGSASGRPTWWRPLTCVEIVKRALDLDAPDVFTPWQLHDVLLRRHGFAKPAADEHSSGSRSHTLTSP